MVNLDLVVDNLSFESWAETRCDLDLVGGGHGGDEEGGVAGGRLLRMKSRSRRHRSRLNQARRIM